MSEANTAGEAAPNERTIVFLVGAVQFVNILDFMMVMPLGPDFARALGVPASQLGLVGGAYTAAASVSGLLGAFFLDRFGRRAALAVSMLGLALGTAAGGFATGLSTLLLARVLAGLFGGPATSVALSIIADVVPAARRGRAMGAVMGAFAAASVLGVPAGLELARFGSWRAPFFAVALLTVVVTALVSVLLPPLRGHLAERAARERAGEGEGASPFASLFTQRKVLLSYAITAMVMLGTFVLVPNISAFTQYNLGYPRERLGMLYLVGGVVSFFAMRASGALVDRRGAAVVNALGTLVLVAVVYVGFYRALPVPVVALFVGFMIANAFRTVPFNTITSRVPSTAERARFMSIQSAVQHLAAALGAIVSSQLLREGADHRLVGMPSVAAITMGLGLCVPVAMFALEAQLGPAPRAKPAAAEALAAGEPEAAPR